MELFLLILGLLGLVLLGFLLFTLFYRLLCYFFDWEFSWKILFGLWLSVALLKGFMNSDEGKS